MVLLGTAYVLFGRSDSADLLYCRISSGFKKIFVKDISRAHASYEKLMSVDMKRIIIVNNNMHIGGVQKALVNLLWGIHEYYDITLLLFYAGGAYLQDLPPDIKVISPNSGYRYFGMTRQETRSPADKLGRTFLAAATRILGRNFATLLMGLSQKQLEGYDVAISYLHNARSKLFYGGCNDFVLNHISAGKKVAFLHGDYMHCGADTPENAKQYAKFDVIAACSQGCADSFLQANPALSEKVKVVYNFQRYEQIRDSAEAVPVKLPQGRINILTVARLGKEKGVTRAIQALDKLQRFKDQFHYYILGDGTQRPQIKEMIRKGHLEGNVTLLGELSNPYGYMKAADLLLIPSVSEAAPMVIGEAASLGTPVLSTATSSAVEMIELTGFGWVCENSVEGIARMLTVILQNRSEIDVRKQYLSTVMLNNDSAMAQFIKLIEEN